MSTSSPVHAFADFELDESLRELRHQGRPSPLRRRPLELLIHLIHNRHRVVSKTELLDALWPGIVVSEAALLSAMRDLRRALRDSGRSQDIIKTHHGFGYRFVAEVRRRARTDGVPEDGRLSARDVSPELLEALEEACDDGGWTQSFARRLVAFIRKELDAAGGDGSSLHDPGFATTRLSVRGANGG